MRKKAEGESFFSWPLPPSILYQHCQAALQLTSITTHPTSKFISCIPTPSCNRTWGKLVLQYVSAGSTLPPRPSDTLLSLSRILTPPLLFIQSFQGRIPAILTLYQGESVQRHSTNFCPLSSMPSISLRPVLWLSFPFLPFPHSHDIGRSHVPSGHCSLRGHQHHLALAAHPKLHRSNRPEHPQSLCVRVLTEYVPINSLAHYSLQYVRISWPHTGLHMSHGWL